MNEQLQNDLLNFDSLLEAVKLQGLDFLKQLSDRPTSTKPNVQLNESLNEIGKGGFDALKLFNEKFENLIVGSAGPRYWGSQTSPRFTVSCVIPTSSFPKPIESKRYLRPSLNICTRFYLKNSM